MTDEISDEDMRAAQYEQMNQQEANYGYADPPEKESMFKFFRDIIKLKDSSKVGNLSKNEMGNLLLPVRNYLDIANFAETQGLNEVADYQRRKAEIVLSTSLSLKGFLAQLFVTQIKKQQKIKQPEQKSSGLFGGKKKEDEESG